MTLSQPLRNMLNLLLFCLIRTHLDQMMRDNFFSSRFNSKEEMMKRKQLSSFSSSSIRIVWYMALTLSYMWTPRFNGKNEQKYNISIRELTIVVQSMVSLGLHAELVSSTVRVDNLYSW